MYDITLTKEALCFYDRADSPLVRKLNHCFQLLSENPYQHPNIKKLTGTLHGRWRFRIGNWRVVYRIEEDNKIVIILVIAHRGSVYE